MADRCQSLPAALWEETYKLNPWYILIKDDVPRVDSRSVFTKSAEKGELFYYDASSQSSTKGYREKGSKSKKVIMTAVCSPRVHVEWSPHIFAPLNDKEKELLEAIPSTKHRYVTFNDQKDYLSFGQRLQIDDCVQVCAGALRVPTANDVHGTLKYIGPLKGQNGTMFGIHLRTNHGDCSGKSFFKCEPMHGIFLPINKLVPVRRRDKPTQQETTKKVKHCRAADLGTEDVPQPTMLEVGVPVEVETTLKDSLSKKTWVKGTIVHIIVCEGNTLFAVELDRFEKPAVNTNGFYKGKSVYKPKKPNSTVIVKQSGIRPSQSSLPSDDLQSFSSSDIKFPPKTWKSEETAGETPSKAKGKAARKSEDQEDEKNNILPASSNFDKILPSPMYMNEHHFVTNSRLKGGTSWPSDNHEKDRQPSVGSKGLFSTFKSSLWESLDPPPFPFKSWHIGVIASDTELFQTLVKELKIKQWPERSQKEANMADIANFIFRKWWKEDIYEGYKESEAKFLEVLESCGYEELVYFIKGGEPHHGRLHDSVIETVLHRAKKYLHLLAKHMEQDIPVDSSHLDLVGEQLFDTWQEQHRGIEKLTLLISIIRGVREDLKSCNRPKQDIDDISDLALELEQGLPGEIIMDISKSVPTTEWRHLGFALGITGCRVEAFFNHHRVLKDRVYLMLRYWQMCESYNVDQAEQLIVALQACNCSDKIASISKGLDETHLRSVADCIDEKWKRVAAVVCNPADFQDISKRSGSDRDKALLVLRKWKRKQPSKVTSLLECLAKTLKECHLHKAARILYDGLDAGTVICLAHKLAFDWQPLGRQLFGEKFQKEKFEAVDDAVQCTFQMLGTWNKKNINNPDRISMLYKALKTIGRQDIEEWLTKYIDSDQTMEYHLQSSPPSSHRQEPEYKRVDQNLLREVAVKLKEGKADLKLLKDTLQIKREDEKSNPMTPSLRIDDPYLSTLLTWRTKMRHHGVKQTQIGQNLREALEMCALPDVASFITDGPPVDRKKDAQQDGAVGGIDPNMEIDFNVSSMVEVEWGGKLYHGTITWIGIVASVEAHGKIAAIEVEENLYPFGTNHYFANQVLHSEKSFESANTLFVPLTRCRPDGRFPTELQTLTEHLKVTSEGETPSKAKGKAARKSENQEDENNKMLPASSNVVNILPSSMNMNEHHLVTNSRLKGGTSWPPDNDEKDGKPPDGLKGLISTFKSSLWKSPGPPPCPFSDFHIEAITYDKKLCQGLIRGLQLENKWKAEKGKEAFFRLEYVLQHWWTQIYEESKTLMQEFNILLVQYGREDLRDHIDKVPDRGMFDDTILNTAIFLARSDWRKFASELGMKQSDIDDKLKQDVLPEESLKIVFHIWYKQEQGCSKLSKLVKACRSIGQHTLAEEIEQGLSEVMLRKIAHQIELTSWQRLGDHLLISPVRQDAFREKFKSLPNRVYHMLSYWSMIQPFGTDKVDGLASALYDVKLGYVAQTLLNGDFGDKDCEPVEGYIDPPKNVDPDRVGMFKGIQGVHNSSYMDATLFSIFAYNSIFDAILFHDESTKENITQVKDVLRTTIVNPLRSLGYVRGDHMLYFCNLLRGLDILQGLQAGEKDPAEFINALLQELMNVKPFLQISQGQNTTMESFMYQIFLDKQDNSDTSTVSDLLHLSFLQADLKLAKVPECLIIQLHKYGKKNKLYDWIIPSLEMDINALIRDSPRKCSDCGKLAFVECKDCTPEATDEDRDVIQSFCRDCYLAKHGKKKHKVTNLSVPLEVTKMFHEIAEKVDEDNIAEKTQHLYPEHRMELFSVVCIETSHSVAFVKTGSGDGEQWVFFDSMADRQGDQHGYNIPEVVHLKNFRQQMESDSLRRDMKRHNFSKYLKRLLSDAYICFYRPVKNQTSSNMDTNSQTTHVRSAQGNQGGYSESNQSILQPHHSLGHTDSPYQKTFNQEPISQQVPQKRNSNQRIEPEERRVMSQGFGDRDLSRGQQHDYPMYDQVANISTDKGTHQNTRCADKITDENHMDWEPSENRGKCNSSQQSGDPSNYSTDQHDQNSGHLKDHGIDQQPRNYKSNQNIGQLRNYNSDRHSPHLSPDTSYTGVNQLGSRSDNIRSQGVSTKHEYENLKGQRSNNDLKTSQQQTSTYPTSTNPPNLPARNKRHKEQQDERWTRQTTPGNSFTSNQDSPGSSTNYMKTALPHSQREGLEAHMTQYIHPQCDSMSPHASLNRDQAGSSKGNSLITPEYIRSKTLPGNQSKGEVKKSSEDDRSGSSYNSEL